MKSEKSGRLSVISLIAAIAAAVMLSAGTSADELGGLVTDELYGAVPGEALDILGENGISPAGGTENISPGDILSAIFTLVSDSYTKPLAMFAAMTAFMLLSSLFSGMGEGTANASLKGTFSMVSAGCAAVVISSYLGEVIAAASEAFGAVSDFMLVYIPILAGVVAASGQAASAAVYGTGAVASIQLLAKLTAAVIVPLTGCLLGIAAAGSVNPDLNLDRLCEGVKKLAVWGLGLIMTIFLGVLSVQTAVTACADSAAVRTAKFAVSSAVPIVGGAVSDALSTVFGSISLLKSGIGGFGIAAGAVMLAPCIVSALCYRFFLFISGMISDILGCGEAGRMIRAGGSVMSVITAALCCFLVFVTVSSAIILVICKGGA